jgi:hypothetical protein
MIMRLFGERNVKLPDRSIDEIKSICRVLFVDDKNFTVLNILIKSGWMNAKRIKDVTSLDDVDIREANIIFIDIQGVGRALQFKDEGLGLIVALKNKYPEKRIIVYSAESTGDRFHEGLSVADASLRKNADPYEFQMLVEKFAKEAFSLEESIDRIRKILREQLGITLSREEVLQKIHKLNKKASFSIEEIGKVFNLQNAANIATIIQLFITGKP